MNFFSSISGRKQGNDTSSRFSRHSSGWKQFQVELKDREALRVLDFGPTSSGNINYLTALGHSCYMADIVQPSKDPSWVQQNELFSEPTFATDHFLDENLAFGERKFDVVLLWDTLDYLTPQLAEATLAKIHTVLAESAKLLAFFHVKPDAEFYRYHLRPDDEVDMQLVGNVDMAQALTTRQIESLFKDYSAYRFFLAKDNLREVVVNR